MKIPDKKVYEKFKLIFGTDLAGCKSIVTLAIGRFVFDIINFDTYCHKFLGYREEKHGSLKDFVTKKFGKDAQKLIMDLINF